MSERGVLARPKLSVVMPAYNEASHIVENMLETIETLSEFCPSFEIVVVDDGSPDGTYLPAIRALAELERKHTRRALPAQRRQRQRSDLRLQSLERRDHRIP